jgi:hypothetical protein
MQSVATLTSNPQVWFGLALGAFLLFAFRVDNAARALGLTVVDPEESGEKRSFSLRDLAKLSLVVVGLLAVLYVLKRLDFLATLAVLLTICLYIWFTGYRSKIRRLQNLGLAATENAVLLSAFILAISSLFVGLAISAWLQRGAP